MPSEQHEQWKRDLFSHLDRKLSGCISCEFGHYQEDHIPSHRGDHREPTQQIMWTCERMHPHTYDVPAWRRLCRNGEIPVGARERQVLPRSDCPEHSSRADSIHRNRAVQPSLELPQSRRRAGHSTLHHTGSSWTFSSPRSSSFSSLVGLGSEPA